MESINVDIAENLEAKVTFSVRYEDCGTDVEIQEVLVGPNEDIDVFPIITERLELSLYDEIHKWLRCD